MAISTGMPAAEDAALAETIRRAGLKVTMPRLAVLRALGSAPHSAAEVLYATVRKELPGTSLQAVYGVLSAFADAGLVRRIEPAGSAARYELRVGDNHHHLVCSRCLAVADVDCAIGASPCLAPADTAGFLVETVEVTFWGLCRDCKDVSGSPVPVPAGPPAGVGGPEAQSPPRT